MRRGLAKLPWAMACAMLAYAFITGGYFVTIMSFAMIYTVFIIGLNVFMGFAGQVSFGHNAFAALSGYTSAVLTATYYWEPIAAFAVGLGLALLVALVVGWPTLRLKGHYLAMATLAIGLIVYEIAIQWQSVTQGYMGISGIAPLGIGSYEIVSERGKLFVLMVFVVLSTFAAARLRASRAARTQLARSALTSLVTNSPRSWSPQPTPRSRARCSCMWWSLLVPKCSDCTWSCWHSQCCTSAGSERSAARSSARLL
jgi:branched-chain amino acid transport system permease protein